ncbi:MAG: hypothetical protein ACRDMJ_13765, partial [Solirubrobacteraceae bacterium]
MTAVVEAESLTKRFGEVSAPVDSRAGVEPGFPWFVSLARGRVRLYLPKHIWRPPAHGDRADSGSMMTLRVMMMR